MRWERRRETILGHSGPPEREEVTQINIMDSHKYLCIRRRVDAAGKKLRTVLANM
jgi:hypothetical protein